MIRTEDIAPGARLGAVVVRREIGSGAFGRVWFGRDERLGRDVALKVLQPRGIGPAPLEDRERFLEEARIMGRFVHPHIATLFALHELEDGGWALELEHLDGGTLEDRLAPDARLPIEEALGIARDLAAALAAAHEAGVIHGDVKPANVLFARDGRAKLVDFGLARLLNVPELAASQKVIQGTPYYLAPEVIGGESFHPASDVWSLGVLLHQMVTGVLPFPHGRLAPLFLAIQNEDAPPMPPDVPSHVAEVVERCLSKRPGDRPADGAALLAALEEPAGAAQRAARAPARAVGAPFGREREAARLAAAVALAAEGRGGVCVLTGPVGMGKSTLVQAATEEARRLGVRVVAATVTPVAGVLRPIARAAASTAEAEAGDGRGRGARAEAHAAHVALEAALARGPLLVAVEDLHLAAPEEVRALAFTVHALRARVFWLLSERTSDLGPSASQSLRCDALLADGGDRLDLPPLSDSSLVRVIEREAEGARFPGAVLDGLVRRCGGNPLFAAQLVRHLRETGALRREGAEWALVGPRAGEAPPALRDLVAERLRGVPEPVHHLLDVAAVDGIEFDGQAVAAVLERPLLAVLRQLQNLVRVQGLVVARDRGYRFAHPLVQEQLHAQVAPDLRRTIHRALAEHLSSRGEEVDPERLGVHWERAGEAERATPHLLRAAREACARLESYRAVDLATRARVLPLKRPPEFVREHAAALFAVAGALGDLGRHAEREALHAAMLEAAVAAGDEAMRWRVIARRGLLRVLASSTETEEERSIEAAATALPDGADRGIALYALGILARVRGDLERARARLLDADACFLRHGEEARHGSALDQLGTVATMSGRLGEAADLHARAAEVCRATGRHANAAISDVNAAEAEIQAGRLDGRAPRLEDAARVLDLAGLVVAAARVRGMLAKVRMSLGDLAGARRAVAEAKEGAERSGHRAAIAEVATVGALVDVLGGDPAAARERVAAARERSSRHADAALRAQLAADAALAEAAAGDLVRARAMAEEAVAALPAGADASVAEVAFSLSLAVACGLDPAPLAPLVARLEALPAATASARAATALAKASVGVADPAVSAAALEALARTLEHPEVGPHRALLRCLAHGIHAEAARRRGDATEAERRRVRRRSALTALGVAPSVFVGDR